MLYYILHITSQLIHCKTVETSKGGGDGWHPGKLRGGKEEHRRDLKSTVGPINSYDQSEQGPRLYLRNLYLVDK